MNQYLRILCVFAILHVTVPANGPKSINLALETQVLFEPEDAFKHMRFIQGARQFLDKLEEAITPRKNALRTDKMDNKKPKSLTTFLYDVVQTILEFHEEELEMFFKVLESEMKSQFRKGSIFTDIIYDPKLQKYVRGKLKEWANADPRKMKAKLRKYIEVDVDQNNPLNNLGGFLNYFYGPEQEEKMREILEQLRRSQEENELANTVRDALDTLVVQHYDRMNYTSRAMLAEEVNKLTNYFTDTVGYAGNDLKLTFRKFIEVMRAKDMFEKAYGKDGANFNLFTTERNKDNLDPSIIEEKNSTKDDSAMLKLIDNEGFIEDYDFSSTVGQKEFTLDGSEYLRSDDKKRSTQTDTEMINNIHDKNSTEDNTEIFNEIDPKTAIEGVHITFNKLDGEKETAKDDSEVFSKIGNDSDVKLILNKDVEISVRAFDASLEDEVVKSETNLIDDVGNDLSSETLRS